MSSYLFLMLAVVCFSLLGVLHKFADFQGCRPAAINAYLFFWAWLLTTVYLVAQNHSLMPAISVTAVAAACGVCASVAILAFQTGIRFGKISTSWLIINLSTAVPTLLSILFYREYVGFRRGAALLAIILSLVCLWKDKQLEFAERQNIN
jgi:drug/metabolite transporter (DMT)-like permease